VEDECEDVVVSLSPDHKLLPQQTLNVDEKKNRANERKSDGHHDVCSTPKHHQMVIGL